MDEDANYGERGLRNNSKGHATARDVSREPTATSNDQQASGQWPVYNLANYTNSGILLDCCRSLLAIVVPPDGSNKQSGTAHPAKQASQSAINKPQASQPHANQASNKRQQSIITSINGRPARQGKHLKPINADQAKLVNDGRDGSRGCESRGDADRLAKSPLKTSKKKKTVGRENALDNCAARLHWWQLIGDKQPARQLDTKIRLRGSPTAAGTSRANVERADFDLANRVSQLTLFVYDQVRPFIELPKLQNKAQVRNRFVLGPRSARRNSQLNKRSLNDNDNEPKHQETQPEQVLPVMGASQNPRRLAWPIPRLARIGRTYSLEMGELNATLAPRDGSPGGPNQGDETTMVSGQGELERFLTLAKNSGMQNDYKFKNRLHNVIRFLNEQKVNSRAAKGKDHKLELEPPHAWSRLASKRGRYGESLVHILLVGNTNFHLILLIVLVTLWPHLLTDTFLSRKFSGLGVLHLCVAYDQSNNQQKQHASLGRQADCWPTDCRLLKFLLDLAKEWRFLEQIRDQRVAGSLFKSPYESAFNSSHMQPDATSLLSSAISSKTLRRLFVARHRVASLNQTGNCNEDLDASKRVLYWCDRQLNWPAVKGHAHLFLCNRMQPASNSAEATQEQSDSLPIYLGDSPLCWSITLRSRACLECLLAAGADLNGRDSDGNTSLHLVIINRQLNWARFLVKAGSRTDARDANGFTPFLLAARLGQLALFNELLDLSAVEFWSYSMIRCCGYPLTALDSIESVADDAGRSASVAGRVRRAWPHSGVLVLLESAETSDQQKARLLTSPVVERLLQEKWQLYARRLFYRELLVFLAHLLSFTLANSLRPLRNGNTSATANQQPLIESGDWLQSVNKRELLRFSSELATFSFSCRQVWRFLLEWRRYANVSLQWTYNPLQPNVLLANAFIIACGLVRLLGRLTLALGDPSTSTSRPQLQLPRLSWLSQDRLRKPEASNATTRAGPPGALFSPGLLLQAEQLETCEEILLVFASPLLWTGLFFFIAAYKVTGPFVAMIRYMIVRDLRQFSFIYLIFLSSFAQCIFYINRPTTSSDKATPASDTPAPKSSSLPLDYVRLWLDLFKMTLGVYELEPFRHSVLARILLLLFIYLIPILFNMLIAMMNNTYSMVISQSERAWSFQWARTLIALERSLPLDELTAYQRQYSINMATKQDGDAKAQQVTSKMDFVPGLMIIKRMSFTQAERKRLVLGYWKKSIKAIVNKIKDKEGKSGVN